MHVGVCEINCQVQIVYWHRISESLCTMCTCDLHITRYTTPHLHSLNPPAPVFSVTGRCDGVCWQQRCVCGRFWRITCSWDLSARVPSSTHIRAPPLGVNFTPTRVYVFLSWGLCAPATMGVCVCVHVCILNLTTTCIMFPVHLL